MATREIKVVKQHKQPAQAVTRRVTPSGESDRMSVKTPARSSAKTPAETPAKTPEKTHGKTSRKTGPVSGQTGRQP